MKTSTILKIVGGFMLVVGVILVVLGLAVFGEDHGGMLMPNFALLAPGAFLATTSFIVFFLGFAPSIIKMQTSLTKEAIDKSKVEMKEVADATADIGYDAIRKTARAAREGFGTTPLEREIHCSQCGGKIKLDSKFCRHCGGEQ